MTLERPRKPLDSILVKPAGPDCNLACEYCFYLGKTDLFPGPAPHRMSKEVLSALMEGAFQGSSPGVSFAWQGGEPTLLGLEFFEEAVRLEKRFGRGRTVANGLQTNGLLLDRDWARFLRKYDFLVGLSLDGPDHVHDRYRRDRSGRGSHARVVDRAQMLLDEDVAVNALAVVNDDSVRFPDETYAFLKDLGLTYMQFIPVVEADPAPFSVPPEAYGEFLCRIFDLWYGDIRDLTPGTFVRFFESVFHAYVGLKPPECTLLPACGEYVVVEHTGEVFSCDFFVETPWRLGNVLEDRLEDLLNAPRQAKFGAQKAALPGACLTCRWRPVCQGGCVKDRIRVADTRGENYFCAAFKRFFAHADSRLRTLAEAWTKREARRTDPGPVGRNDPCPCGSGRKFKKCCGNT